MPESRSLLSSQGEQTRKRILGRALAAARRRRRRRVLARAAVLAILVGAFIPWVFRTRPPHDTGIAVNRVEPLPQPQPVAAPPVLTRIETDPDIIERLAIRPPPSRVIVINDTELLSDLAMADRPAGLAYVNGKASLLFR